MPPPACRPAFGDGQPGDAHARTATDVEDPAGIVPAHGEPVFPGAVDRQVLAGDGKLTARQLDGAMEIVGEVNQVRAAVGVGAEDRRPERTGTGIIQVIDHERTGTENGPAFQRLQPKEAGPWSAPHASRGAREDQGREKFAFSQAEKESKGIVQLLLSREGKRKLRQTASGEHVPEKLAGPR